MLTRGYVPAYRLQIMLLADRVFVVWGSIYFLFCGSGVSLVEVHFRSHWVIIHHLYSRMRHILMSS